MSHGLQQESALPPTTTQQTSIIKSVDGGNVSDRLEKIKTASEGWKKRVGKRQ